MPGLTRRLFLLVATMMLIACGSGSGESPDSVTASLTNGYQLTKVESTDEGGKLYTSAVIVHDATTNSVEWTGYDSGGFVTYRDVLAVDASGRQVSAESYLPTGALEHTSEYTIDRGLITQRSRSTGEILTLTYTDNDVVAMREYSSEGSGIVTRRIVNSHDAQGRIASSSEFFFDDAGDSVVGEPRVRRFEYDSADRVVSIAIVDDTFEEIEEFTYDENGNNTQIVVRDSFGTINYRSVYSFEKTASPMINYRLRVLKFFL